MNDASKTVAFLHKASQIIPNTKLANAIRCNIIEKCHIYKKLDDIHLPAQYFGKNVLCSGCGVKYSTSYPLISLEPSRNLNRYTNNLLKKKAKNLLTTKEEKKLQKCISSRSQKLVVTCNLCRKESKTILNKPVRPKQVYNNAAQTSTKKKKKNKDKYSGLNKSAVELVQKRQDSNHNNNSNENIINVASSYFSKNTDKIDLVKSSPSNLSKKRQQKNNVQPNSDSIDIIDISSPVSFIQPKQLEKKINIVQKGKVSKPKHVRNTTFNVKNNKTFRQLSYHLQNNVELKKTSVLTNFLKSIV